MRDGILQESPLESPELPSSDRFQSVDPQRINVNFMAKSTSVALGNTDASTSQLVARQRASFEPPHPRQPSGSSRSFDSASVSRLVHC
ncbi:hypothetical protein BS47DRAFT_38112 [Hydnum rufescens UP504]|uniref:Uncharacterized protein n=1 Tax=Hydnum rufescens UP504 TaxID=1448309 RepID=A0A9P6ABV3_9AGAM|nr:hypothetical protein BS47DRAFT_38112 [Hydnum rufescens UP504]